MENCILDYLRDNFGFDIARMLFYCSNIPCKMVYEGIGAEFWRISRATSKTEDLSHTCKQVSTQMLKQNGQMRRIKFSLIKKFLLNITNK